MIEVLQTRRLFVIILAIGLFVMAAREVTDPDVWWHLRTGQLIVQTHQIPRADPYSFTRLGEPWIDHEWLSQLLIYGLFRIGGWAVLTITFGVVFAAALMLVFVRSSGKPFIAGAMVLLGAFASAPSWGVRPQMLTFLLTSVTLLLLDRSYAKPRLLWWIPPLMLLWANLHAGYALGIGLLILFAIGDALDSAFGFVSWPKIAARLRTLIAVIAASTAVVVINPYGWRMYLYPFQTLHSRTMAAYINEWNSPNFHEGRYAPLLIMILASVVLPAISQRRSRPRDLLLLTITTFAALRSVRHVPIYVLVAVPIFSAMIESLCSKKQFVPQKLTPAKAALNAMLLAGFVAFVIFRLHFVISRQPQSEAEHFPAAAVAFIKAKHSPGPMFNHYDWGGYLIYQLYPDYPVFIDGRADVYGDAVMDDFFNLYWVRQPDWQQSLDRRGIKMVLLPPDAPLVTALRETQEWKEIYADKLAVILAHR
ncbi:MAG TPA: hypothetical protein VF753_04920 [Terriglobales bacterium]